MTLTEADKKTLNLNAGNLPLLSQAWCQLNRFEWPKWIPDPEPAHTDHGRRDLIMECIEQHISFKECLREWNRERMPGKSFDEWWANRPVCTL